MLRSIGLAGMMSLVLLSAPARAFDIVTNDHGGHIEPYTAKLARANARNEPVRIANVECFSSCTLYLAARNACISPHAVFGFHAPWIGLPNQGTVDPQMVAMFARSYKPELRRLFLEHVRNSHGVVPGPLLRLSGQQLAGLGYRLCGEAEVREAAASHGRRYVRNNGVGRVNPSAMGASPDYGFPGWFQ
jgi:hypothetical protein